MAEFVFRHLVEQRKQTERFSCASAATSREELGNDIHPGTRRILQRYAIPFTPRCATQIRSTDYAKYDLLIGMDKPNCSNALRIFGSDPQAKIHTLLAFTEHPREIADPWYTGDFEQTYADVVEGCTALLNALLKSRD